MFTDTVEDIGASSSREEYPGKQNCEVQNVHCSCYLHTGMPEAYRHCIGTCTGDFCPGLEFHRGPNNNDRKCSQLITSNTLKHPALSNSLSLIAYHCWRYQGDKLI